MSRITVSTLQKMKQDGEKISTITAYDASFSHLFDEAGIHAMLIGDSLGMVLQGKSDTLPVTIEEISYHTECVRAGATKALILADLPFMTYATPEQTYENAAKLMRAGANMVKLEGGAWLVETIKGLVERSVPVCGHLGLTPQSVNVFGGFKVQGRDNEKAMQMIEDAKQLEAAGIQLLVLECIPVELAKAITDALTIPVIGIGAGNVTDGQILVMHDAFGISVGKIPKFSRNFLADAGDIRAAVALYKSEVESGNFPGPEHCFN
ncbi:3-methyl-2-oxobutanoate hydroxymethyltransferase [Thalassotalea sp. HSM 43]|uniref:3-methyl-2-oxobutanoate hydroxymethyltransferase n=1 Tax=Thalassotalea sp. HSM 43 TaxID=2552945 RepID=UPI001081545F|nr:3-methyl-2-oxobutanoate hydroxymethyltransferase [Thalassotalea sp. HSM 43]QBY04734.1 3-methyl-2-oxobutanoate hydroxymethyltransferase [Thalassotalea sp. HSM 43]